MRPPANHVLVLALALAACARSAPPAEPAEAPPLPSPVPSHYYGAVGGAPAEHEASWGVLHAFFGAAMPARIEIIAEPSGPSHFDPARRAIFLSSERDGQTEKAVVAHETAHLALAELTGDASTLEELRFVDEGLASIFQERVEGRGDAHRTRVLRIAAGRSKTGSVRLADVRAWSTYFGSPTRGADYVAYDVGAAFDYFLIDTFGVDAFRSLLVDLGRTRSLDDSAPRALGRSLDTLERAWSSFLGRLDVAIPRVIEMSPPHGARSVPEDRREIFVRFDVPMGKGVHVMTDCADGICFDHAYWRDERTLAIRIDRPLLAHHRYAMSLGTKRGKLKSREGVEAPLTAWEFETR